MKMKNLTIRLVLLILCALNLNTAFAQDVRQKPVAKEQTLSVISEHMKGTEKDKQRCDINTSFHNDVF